jgi:hypothetical protein
MSIMPATKKKGSEILSKGNTPRWEQPKIGSNIFLYVVEYTEPEGQWGIPAGKTIYAIGSIVGKGKEWYYRIGQAEEVPLEGPVETQKEAQQAIQSYFNQ